MTEPTRARAFAQVDARCTRCGKEGHTASSCKLVLVLPYPISANRYWRSFVPRGHVRAIVTLSDEAKFYKEQVSLLAWQQGVREPIEGRVRVHIALYPNRPQDWKTRQRKFGAAWDDTVQCIDLDNARKVLYDALKDVAFGDDKWIRADSAERMEPDEHGARVVVTITPIALEQPQAPLCGTDDAHYGLKELA